MKLWLLYQEVNDGWDTYDSAVVAALTEDEARRTEVGSGSTWAAPEHVHVRWIGDAAPGVKAGVICASFNAG